MIAGARREEPGQIAPVREGDRRRPRGADLRAALGEAAPAHLAREAKLVEPRRVVAFHARGQDVALPPGRGDLEPLELADHAEHPFAPLELRPRRDVLPREVEAHQIRG